MHDDILPQAAPPRQRSLCDLPKTHLHVHLDGSYPLDAVEALARKSGIDFRVPEAFTDVWAFFDAYGQVPHLVRSLDDLAMLCRALILSEAREGVRYIEPAIEPQLYAPRLGSLEQVTRAMLMAFAEAAADSGVEIGALVTINTDADFEIAGELARIAAKYAGRGVNGLGTAGFLEPGNLRRFRSSAQIAQAVGLPVISHAGQTGGADCVEEALDELGATRIAHGFRAIESEDTVKRLADDQIVCDVCPISNLRLGVVPDMAHHPAPKLLRAGVPVTLNADDSLWFGAGVTAQFEVARHVWSMTDAELAEFARAGARATGMSLATREALLADIEDWIR
ncbi:adenosine deaminase [Celeribacter sp. HF31]|uniref:adenosine deaminase n=1 Tax=Celeribacter sp. HF31 TaxID=2721558 RepID=UPI00142FCA65|nr:adenosine deaminase [Celeribacter sp. HF31]NIY80792.1 adenosine deaminase [Celeribacter sp. HF31]